MDYKETLSILNEVYKERKSQVQKWGDQVHSPANYLMILGEEVGEANKAALEFDSSYVYGMLFG
jgi:hypothetical protein